MQKDSPILAFDFEREGFPEWLGLVDEKIEAAAARIMLLCLEHRATPQQSRELVSDEIRRVLGLPPKYQPPTKER